ncbi:MAG: hypothetical protein XXXJIFNMEKO3_00125 [Candidatus Erwinia impunctatus]
MIKKINSLAILVAALGCSSVLHAADGVINFTGNITDKACTVDTASAN